MRITLISACLDMSGGSRVIATYAHKLHELGHEVLVVAPPPAPPSLRQRVRRLVRGESRRERRSHYDGIAARRRELERHRAVTAADLPDADLLVATWWETAEWIAAMPSSKGRHVHFIQHYEAFEGQSKERVDAALRLPSFKITISRWLTDLMRDMGNDRVACVLNSVDTAQFHAPPRGRGAPPTVGMLYSDVDWKDCDVGFAAFERVRERLPDVRLRTFGGIPERRHLPLPSGATHTVLPPQDSIRDIYAECDVWLCPSRSEGFGLPMVEAMACRCPVVSTPVGGAVDFIDDDVNGFIVPAGDAGAMADRLLAVLTCGDAQWRAMSDAALQRVLHYSWDDATRLFEAALRAAIATDRPQG